MFIGKKEKLRIQTELERLGMDCAELLGRLNRLESERAAENDERFNPEEIYQQGFANLMGYGLDAIRKAGEKLG